MAWSTKMVARCASEPGGIGTGFGVLADDFDELIDAIFFRAEEQGDVPAAEKAADGVDAGWPRIAHPTRVSVMRSASWLCTMANTSFMGVPVRPFFLAVLCAMQPLYHIGTPSRSRLRISPPGPLAIAER